MNVVWGGYVLKDVVGMLDLILIVIGFEVELVVKVVEVLEVEGKKVCVVLMLSINVFDK